MFMFIFPIIKASIDDHFVGHFQVPMAEPFRIKWRHVQELRHATADGITRGHGWEPQQGGVQREPRVLKHGNLPNGGKNAGGKHGKNHQQMGSNGDLTWFFWGLIIGCADSLMLEKSLDLGTGWPNKDDFSVVNLQAWWRTCCRSNHAIQWFVHGQPYPTLAALQKQQPVVATKKKRSQSSPQTSVLGVSNWFPKLHGCVWKSQIITLTCPLNGEYHEESIYLGL